MCVGFHYEISTATQFTHLTTPVDRCRRELAWCMGEQDVVGRRLRSLLRQVIQRVVGLLVQQGFLVGRTEAGEVQFVDVSDLQAVDDQVDVSPVRGDPGFLDGRLGVVDLGTPIGGLVDVGIGFFILNTAFVAPVQRRSPQSRSRSRIAVGGESAGANLAAAVTLKSAAAGLPTLAFQLLMYPVTAHGSDMPSHKENAEGYFLTTEMMGWFWAQYLPTATDGKNPLASPLQATLEQCRSVPPAFIATAQYDPLRDEGAAYAEKLRDAGVPAKYKCYDCLLYTSPSPRD